MKLTIPIHNKRDTIRLRDNAEELLKAIEDSSHESNNAYEKLKAGYQRLWNLGASHGFNEIRVRLFRLILCSFEPLSVNHLILPLRIQVGSDELKELSAEDIEDLYLNFLMRDGDNWLGPTEQQLRFTHASAREFVMREILGKTSGDSQKYSKSEVMKKNHRSVADLFLEVLQRSDHKYWDQISPSPHHPFDQVSEPPEHYIISYGLQHCRHAAKKQSISEGLWSDVIERVLLPPKSAFAKFAATTNIYSNTSTTPLTSSIFRESEGKHHLLFASALVWLDIIHNDDVSDIQLRDLRTAPSIASIPEGILRHFAEHAVMKSSNGTNALHLASFQKNVAALKLVLGCTYNVFGKEACTDLLFAPVNHGPMHGLTPFTLALCQDKSAYFDSPIFSCVPVIQTLLSFESQYLAAAGEEKIDSSQASHKVQQWSQVVEGKNDNALGFAVKHLRSENLCYLLKIAEPATINDHDPLGHTPLYIAVKNNRFRIMRALVEDCHADINIKTRTGVTALDIARYCRSKPEVHYLTKRMSISRPVQSADLIPEVDKTTS